MHCFVFKIAQIVFLLIDRHVYVTSYVTNSILRFNGQTGKKLEPRINYVFWIARVLQLQENNHNEQGILSS